MDIPYVIRKSTFLEPCRSALLRMQPATSNEDGDDVLVELGPGGYNGTITVILKNNGSSCFEASWVGIDATRFPARIRAAATALKSCGWYGRFEIEHKDGRLVMRVRERFKN